MPHSSRLDRRVLRALAAPATIALLLSAPVPSSASSSPCTTWKAVTSPSPGSSTSMLNGIAATSASDAWAAGVFASGNAAGRTLIEHWNGSAWKQVPSPNQGLGDNILEGVAATSAKNAWAVGLAGEGSKEQTLILHWDGTGWKRVASPDPGGSAHQNFLLGVTATSGGNAWAVGAYFKSTFFHTLVLHWNGSAWRQVTDSNANRFGLLTSVTATSASNAWAVGDANTATTSRVVMLHWNGHTWSRTRSHRGAGFDELLGVTATSAKDAWAVGGTESFKNLALHWNGSAWKRVATPNPGTFGELFGVAATSPSNAWAVGVFGARAGTQTLLLHWNGSAWKRVPSPSPSPSQSDLFGVAATSPSTAWAVGYHGASNSRTLVLECG